MRHWLQLMSIRSVATPSHHLLPLLCQSKAIVNLVHLSVFPQHFLNTHTCEVTQITSAVHLHQQTSTVHHK
ncbi:hypothetical protein JOB18_042906 [Solea senegalensis]|uniref:Uncharacterized protein n=1 Tax=Solea senegalensis TaxID=28829 RepID=A0AAV6SUT5_SOLSE|nr:hypothetical protein JOB18_042906 [Solea senegalensis]